MITPTEQSVLDRVDDDELIRWVQELTRIPSVWKPEQGIGEEAAARWVEARCLEIGLNTHFEFVAPGRPNVIAVLSSRQTPTPDSRFPTLMFEGHTDVVTEGDPAQWTDSPFSATVRDGRIYGRGANDMKAGLCCALMAIKAIVRSGVKLNGDILLGAVCDEEGRMLGIKHFVERGWADRVDAAIICEPEENHLCIAQRGVMWMRVVIRGVMSHGALPFAGANSAYPMARFLNMVHALEERQVEHYSPFRRHVPVGGPGDALLDPPSITPTIVLSPVRGAGEAQNNVMPGATECVLDVRLVPGQDASAIAQQIERLLRAATVEDARLSYTMDVLEMRHPTKTDRTHPVVTTLASAYTDLTGDTPVYGGVPGTTDGTILHARKGIPIVTCGPGAVHMPHRVDEWVSVDEIKLAARMYVLAAMRYFN